MKGYKSIGLTLLSVLIITIIVSWSSSCLAFNDSINPPPFPPRDFRDIFETYILIKTVITTINLILLMFLLIIYIRIYNNTGSKFSLGLVFFTIALILYAVTSNPILHVFTGFRISGLGPFTMLPDLFTLIASAILLYLSRK